MPEVVAGGWFARHGMSLSPGGRLGQYPPDKMADAHSNTNSESYIHLCTQMYNPPHTPSGRSCLSPPAGFNPPRSRQPLGLHGHRTSSLLSRWPGTYLPTAESEFCKSHSGTLAPLTIISTRRCGRQNSEVAVDRSRSNRACTFRAGLVSSSRVRITWNF